CVPDQKSRMKSSIFDNTKERSPKDSNLIASAGVTVTESELSIHVAQSTVRSLSEFIERNRARAWNVNVSDTALKCLWYYRIRLQLQETSVASQPKRQGLKQLFCCFLPSGPAG